MLMDSNTLRNQKNNFIKSVDDYNIKYKNILQKVKQISVSLEYSNDNLLYNFIRENNTKIVEKINNLLINIGNDKKATIQRIDERIAQLEEQERLEKEKMSENLDG